MEKDIFKLSRYSDKAIKIIHIKDDTSDIIPERLLFNKMAALSKICKANGSGGAVFELEV